MAQNLFRRHRGTRSETATINDNESSTNRNESSSTSIDNNNDQQASTDTAGGGVSTNSTDADIENPPVINVSNQNDQEEPLGINEQDQDDDEIQELVIRTNSTSNNNNNNSISTTLDPTNQFPNWTLNEEEINTRREAIRIEIERMQRANFVHFVVLCLVPTSLLLIVIAAILTEDGECSGDGLTVCEREPRTFVNAFTTRCICEAVGSVLMDSGGGENEEGGL